MYESDESAEKRDKNEDVNEVVDEPITNSVENRHDDYYIPNLPTEEESLDAVPCGNNYCSSSQFQQVALIYKF